MLSPRCTVLEPSGFARPNVYSHTPLTGELRRAYSYAHLRTKMRSFGGIISTRNAQAIAIHTRAVSDQEMRPSKIVLTARKICQKLQIPGDIQVELPSNLYQYVNYMSA